MKFSSFVISDFNLQIDYVNSLMLEHTPWLEFNAKLDGIFLLSVILKALRNV